MDKKQVLIITLLIVAILFSAASIVINMEIGDFEISRPFGSDGGSAGSNEANLNIEVLPQGTAP